MALLFIAVQVLAPASLFGATAAAASAEPDQTQGNRFRPAAVTSTPNPTLSQACGLDIALVLDNSTSISSSELASMKNAMTAFTGAFVGTPTQFSVTRFASSASVLQGFTADTSSVNAAINSIPSGGGYTNWEDGLAKAASTFDPRPTVPNLVIFASDGDPTASSAGPNDTSQPNAHLSPAVTQANAIKASGTRIMTIGIGGPTISRLQAISGPNVNTGDVLTSDVITSDFSTLANDLATFAEQTCGGTITINKVIDQDGNPNTTNDRTAGVGWSFDINGSPSNPAPVATDANGQTVAVDVEPGTYSVNEVSQAGFDLISATCTGASGNGSKQGNAVVGVSVDVSDIISCTFVNAPKPTITLQKTVINDNGGTKTAADFQGKVDGSNVSWNVPVTVNPGTHTASEATAVDYEASDWGGSCGADGSVQLGYGQHAVCTITNDDISPVLTLTKVVSNPYGPSADVSAFKLFVGNTEVKSGDANSFDAGSHQISEVQLPGYHLTSLSGDCSLDQNSNIIVLLSLASHSSCILTNTAIQPRLIVKKVVINDDGGTKSAGDFTMTVSGNSAQVPNFAGDSNGTTVGLNEGFYSVDELTDNGYAKTFSGDCSGTISIGEEKTCTITNDDVAPTLTLRKTVINDNGGTAEAADWTLTATPESQGPSTISGNGQNGVVNQNAVAHETYSLSEAGPDGYDSLGWNCYSLSGTFSYPNGQSNEIRMSEGARVTCYVTNDDTAIPGISVKKSGPATAHRGETVEYTFTVTNAGNTPLDNVTVSDSIAGAGVYQSGDSNGNMLLDVDETWVYTADYVIPNAAGTYVDNTVTTCGDQAATDTEEVPEIFSLQSVINPTPDPVQVCATDSHRLTVVETPVKVQAEPTSEPELAYTGDPATKHISVVTIIALANVVTAVAAFSIVRRRQSSSTQ